MADSISLKALTILALHRLHELRAACLHHRGSPGRFFRETVSSQADPVATRSSIQLTSLASLIAGSLHTTTRTQRAGRTCARRLRRSTQPHTASQPASKRTGKRRLRPKSSLPALRTGPRALPPHRTGTEAAAAATAPRSPRTARRCLATRSSARTRAGCWTPRRRSK